MASGANFMGSESDHRVPVILTGYQLHASRCLNSGRRVQSWKEEEEEEEEEEGGKEEVVQETELLDGHNLTIKGYFS